MPVREPFSSPNGQNLFATVEIMVRKLWNTNVPNRSPRGGGSVWAARAETLGVWVLSSAKSQSHGSGMFKMHATSILTPEVREHVSFNERKG